MAAYFFASPIDVDVKLEGEEARKQVEMKGEKEKIISCPVYYDGDSVGGQVCVLYSLGAPYNRDLIETFVGGTGNNTCPRWKEVDA